MKDKKLIELIKFCLVGGGMTVLNMALLAFFVEICKTNYLIGNVISYSIAVFISYFVNVVFTFQQTFESKKKEIHKMGTYFGMKLIMLSIDSGCLFLLVDQWHVNLYISKIILTVVLTILSFSFSRMIMSKKKENV